MPRVCGRRRSSPFVFRGSFYNSPSVFFSPMPPFPSPGLGASGPLLYLCTPTLQPAPSQGAEPRRLPRKPLRPLPPPPPSARPAPGLQEPPGKMRRERRPRAAWRGPAQGRGSSSPAARAASCGPRAPLRASPSTQGCGLSCEARRMLLAYPPPSPKSGLRGRRGGETQRPRQFQKLKG